MMKTDLGFIKKREDIPDLITSMGLKIGAEIGVCRGLYSECILANTENFFLFSVDWWKVPKYYDEARERLGSFDRSCLLRMDSSEAASLFAKASFDFVYLDTRHKYEFIKKDIDCWYEKVKPGGVFSGHDYCRYKEYGVIEAVQELVKSENLKLHVTEEEWPSWLIVKSTT